MQAQPFNNGLKYRPVKLAGFQATSSGVPLATTMLQRLCRYITRPALANERVQCNAAGQVVLKLKTQFQWRLTCTQVMS